MRDLQFINDLAVQEGWCISECSTAEHGIQFQLQKVDEPEPGQPTFCSDTSAWEHVCRKALEGSDLHQAALLYLKGSEIGTYEWLAINTHAVSRGLIAPLEEVV